MSLEEQRYSYKFRIQSAKLTDFGDEPDKGELQSLVYDILGITDSDKEKSD